MVTVITAPTTSTTGTTSSSSTSEADSGDRSPTNGGLRSLLPLALTVCIPVLIRGGFTPGSQWLLIGLASVSLALVLGSEDQDLAGIAKAPAILCLTGLAGLSALSALWTVADPATALRTGLVIAALAATALLAADAARRFSLWPLAALLAILAVSETVIGLGSAALRVEPFAEQIGGSWRPGGTFEYPPALALLGVMALPVLGAAMARGRPPLAIGSAAGAALIGATIGLANSRYEALLAGLVLAAIVALPELTINRSRRTAFAIAGVVILSALATHLWPGGGSTYDGDIGGDLGRLAALATIPLLAGAAWAGGLARGALGDAAPDSHNRRIAPVLAGAALVAVCMAAALAVASDDQVRAAEPVSGVTHGRTQLWGAAIDTALDHPVTGAGTGGFHKASHRHQDSSHSRFAHELPLEGWAELGPLGLALVLGLYGSVAVLLWRIRRRPEAWLLAPATAAFLLANLIDWPWHLTGLAAVWALALGGCLALGQSAGRPV